MWCNCKWVQGLGRVYFIWNGVSVCDGKERPRQFCCSVRDKTLFHLPIAQFKEPLFKEESIAAIFPLLLQVQSESSGCRSLTVCWMTWHLIPSLIMAGDDGDYCYGRCRSDSAKVLRAAHTAGSSATRPYFCHDMHITDAGSKVREDLCTCANGPVKYWRPASVGLCDPGGRTGILKTQQQHLCCCSEELASVVTVGIKHAAHDLFPLDCAE